MKVGVKVKKNYNFIFYLMGRIISLTGSGFQIVALPLYMYDKTHSGFLMGLISIMTWLPVLITTPFSGIIGDSKNRRNVMIYMDFGRGALIITMGLLAFYGRLSLVALFIIQAFVSSMDEIFGSSSYALMPELSKNIELTKAYSVRGSIDGIAYLIGPALGGIIYGFWGIKLVFLLNGLSFILSGICSCFIRNINRKTENNKIALKSFFFDNLEALRFIKEHKGLFEITVFGLLVNFLTLPLSDILFPYVLKGKIGFSSMDYGYILAFFTLGGILGNILMSTLLKNVLPQKILKLGIAIEPMVLIIFYIIITPQFVMLTGGHGIILLIILFIFASTLGISLAFINTVALINQQKMVPDNIRSRYGSVSTMLSTGAIPIGSLIYGFLIDRIHYLSLFLFTVIILAIIFSMFLIFASNEMYNPSDFSNQEEQAL